MSDAVNSKSSEFNYSQLEFNQKDVLHI